MGEDFKFPEPANIFTKIVENSNFHENKIKYLEAYVREISEVPVISNSKIFRKFFDFHLNVEENFNLNLCLNENFEAGEKLNSLRASNKTGNLSYRSENSDSNQEEGKINTNANNNNNNYGFANTYRNSSNYSSQKNNIYADSEGKITFENNNSAQKNKVSDNNNYNNLISNRSFEFNKNSN